MKFVENLDANNIKSLDELLKTSKNYKVRQRAHAILLSGKKMSIATIADIFEVDRDTVSDWIKRWEQKGITGLKDSSRPGRPKKKKKTTKKKSTNKQTPNVTGIPSLKQNPPQHFVNQ